ncbi:MAG: transcriptional repressor [Candidatus Bipolaricaulota bacterium]
MDVENGIERFTRFLRASRFNVTEARRRVAHEALCMEGHFEAAELWARLQKSSNISFSTVYRTLSLLVQAGLLRVIDLGDPHAHFEAADEAHHEHLVCSRCGHVVEVEDESLNQAIGEVARVRGFQPEGHSLRVFGLCKKCRQGG